MVALNHHEKLGSLLTPNWDMLFCLFFNGKTFCLGKTTIAILTVIFRLTPNHWDGKPHKRRPFI